MKNQDQILPAEKTIGGIFRDKFLKWLEKSTIKKILTLFLQFVIILFIILFLVNHSFAFLILKKIFFLYNFLILKSIFVILIFKYRKKLFSFKKKSKKTIDGIETSELLHFIFTKKAFKLNEFKKTFGLSRNIHEKIAKKLEHFKVLIRGENNARVLNSKFSLEEVKNLLDGAKTSDQISFMRILKAGDQEILNNMDKKKEVRGIIQKEKAEKGLVFF